MRVCVVSPFPPPHGGIAQWATLIHGSGQIADEVLLIQVNTIPRWRTVDDLSFWKRLIGGGIQLCRDYLVFIKSLLKHPHVIHLASSGGLGVVRDITICITAKLFRTPLVYHLHFGRIPQIAATNTLEWRLLTLSLLLANVVICITPQTYTTIINSFPNIWLEYIPNPVDNFNSLQSTESASHKKQVLFLGWVIPTKGIDELVQAWAKIHSRDWELLIVGPGKTSYQKELTTRYRPNNIKFIGEVQHIQAIQLISQSEIFVLPSYTEGFPNVILEAMICGKPIIATSVGAIPDILFPNCGILIDSQDVESLEVALIELMSNKTLRDELGARAREKAMRDYVIDVISSKYLDIWKEVKNK